MGYVRDIWNRLIRPVRAPAEATANEAFTADRYQRTFNSWVTGIYETTVDAKYVTANPALARMFGYESPAEMMAIITDADTGCYVERGRRLEFVRLMHQRGAVTGFEAEVYRKDRSRFWISEDAIAVRDVSGRLTGFYGTIIDITARKRAEAASRDSDERLRASQTRLQWLDALRRELVANVSHDLRTPLTALKGYLDYLVARPATPQDIRQEYLASAVRQAERLERLIAQLFNLATLESDVQLQSEDFSICELAHDVAQGLQLEAAKRSVTVVFEMMDDVPVRADIRLIERVLQNLLDNAIRHTAPGTLVRMSCRATGGLVVFRIADNGPGMPAHAEGVMRTAGLGLAIVRRILALHDGELRFPATADRGTIVEFQLAGGSRQDPLPDPGRATALR